MNTEVFRSIEKLERWIYNEKFMGWDPYDLQSSPLFENVDSSKVVKLSPLFFILRFSPWNIRSIFKIKKTYNSQGISLFIISYIELYRITEKKKYYSILSQLYKILKEQSLKRYTGYHCWGTPFNTFVKNRIYKPTEPGIVNTSLAILALSKYYTLTRNEESLHLIKSSLKFVKKMYVEEKNIAFFRYRPSIKELFIINGSALVMEAISESIKILPEKMLLEMCEKTLNTILKYQNNMGIWPYSVNLKSHKVKWQTDFHQGYVLNGLMKFYPNIEDKDLRKKVIQAIKNGANVYLNKQFDGPMSYYRYPTMKYPVDIINQAQGIITSSNLYSFFNNDYYLKKAIEIADWTIKNMQDPSGYFYYQRWPFMINKIPYMRWGQAWMLLALSTLLKNIGDQNESSCGE